MKNWLLKKQAQRLKTESAKKEYDAKGTGYLDAGGGLESMSDTELRDATSQMLEEAYTKGELTNIKSSIDALVAGRNGPYFCNETSIPGFKFCIQK